MHMHTFQPKNGREALFALIADLRKAPKWFISECNIFFGFHNLVTRQDTRKIHVNKNWDANTPYTSHQWNEEKSLHINIVQVVAPPSSLKKSKCKNSRELKKTQELFLRLGILINIILIKSLSINMDLHFQKFRKFSKKI